MDSIEKSQELAAQYWQLMAQHGPKVIAALIILVAGYLAAKLVRGLVRRVLGKTEIDATLVSFAANLTYMTILVFVAIAALDELGVATTSFAAVVAAAGLAIGLALQNSLGNFASGFLIILLEPFKAGDFVEVAGIKGVVEAIKVFSTQLRTPDNKTIIVPNSAVIGDTIVNYSARATRRVDMVFGIGYEDDLRKAREILERILAEDERVLEDPAPSVVVMELADSSVNFAVRPWVKTSDAWDVRCDVTEQVKLEFDAHGISIPYPQQDVHLHTAVEAATP